MRQIFLDTETTGLSPESGDRIVEIGCIEMVNRRLTGETLHCYLNPERLVGDSERIHGLSDAYLADKPLFASVVDQLMAFVGGAEIIIHNAEFDLRFLNEELRRLGRPKFTENIHGVTDTLLMAREMFPGKSNSLDALCKRLEVDNTSRTLHGALLDAGLLAEVYIRLTRGQGSLVIESNEASGGPKLDVQAVDLTTFALPLVPVSEDEKAAHDKVLAELDKASGGTTLWRALAQPENLVA
jgi:DNA polymerase-3 subunit epsilon